MGNRLTIVVATKNRCGSLRDLLGSIKDLRGLSATVAELIVADNDSADQTWSLLQREGSAFPVPLRLIKVTRPGKSAALNEATRIATGEILAFLDDDVLLDAGWLEGVNQYFNEDGHAAGQGIIRLSAEDSQDPGLQQLIERYRTIPRLEYGGFDVRHSLNGANMAIHRDLFQRLNGFDERLGPGTSGTSEDVELAYRIRNTGAKIGCMKYAIAYHRVDRARLTESYFKLIHKRQGHSRLLFKKQKLWRIVGDLCLSTVQYAYKSLLGNERDKYRSKGRIYHYWGMIESKWNGQNHSACTMDSPDREPVKPSDNS